MKYFVYLMLALVSYGAKASANLPEMHISTLDKGLFLHESYNRIEGYGLVSSNGLVVEKNGNALIVDTPWNDRDTEILVKWIRDKGLTLVGSISTHFHSDRSAGIRWLNENGIATFASKHTNLLLKKHDKAMALHNLSEDFSRLPESIVEVFYPGAGHSLDNIVVWLEHSKTLYGGCLVRSAHAKGLGNTADADVKEWPLSVAKLMQKYATAKRVIPGHGEVGDKTLLTHTEQLAQSHVRAK